MVHLAKCSKCSFEWEKGTDGIHDCVEVLQKYKNNWDELKDMLQLTIDIYDPEYCDIQKQMLKVMEELEGASEDE